MANDYTPVSMIRGSSTIVDSTPIVDGQILFDETRKCLFMDNGSTREKYSGLGADSNIANVEDTTTASQPYTTGEFVVVEGQLYKVTASIATGDTFSVGTNIATDTVGSELTKINNDLSAKANLKLVSDATKQIRFGTDSSGNYGYYKDGADSVTPFKRGAIKVTSITGNRTATRTVDCTSLSNYQSLTVNNFILDIKQVVAYTDAAQGGNGTPAANISKSYNSSTGVLTISGLITSYNPAWYWNQYVYTSSFDVYYIDL